MAKASNVTVRMLVSAGSASESWQPGDTASFPAATAKRLVESGQAEYMNEKKTATKSPKEKRA